MNQTSRIVSRAASILFIAAIPLFLVTSNVRVLVGEVRFYERGLRENNAAAVTGISLDDMLFVGDRLDRLLRERRLGLRVLQPLSRAGRAFGGGGDHRRSP